MTTLEVGKKYRIVGGYYTTRVYTVLAVGEQRVFVRDEDGCEITFRIDHPERNGEWEEVVEIPELWVNVAPNGEMGWAFRSLAMAKAHTNLANTPKTFHVTAGEWV